jgi:uncharacterized membrane protein
MGLDPHRELAVNIKLIRGTSMAATVSGGRWFRLEELDALEEPEDVLEVDVEDVHANAVNAHHAIGVN